MGDCAHTWDDVSWTTDGFNHFWWECPCGTIFGLATANDIQRERAHGQLQAGDQLPPPAKW